MRFEYRVRDHNGDCREAQVEAGHKDAVVTGLLDQQYYHNIFARTGADEQEHTIRAGDQLF